MGSVEHYDAWPAALSYERYMGRWSRRLAVPFVDRLEMSVALDWLEVGCGTGALSAVVLDLAAPASLVGIDPSPGFVEYATSRAGPAPGYVGRLDADHVDALREQLRSDLAERGVSRRCGPRRGWDAGVEVGSDPVDLSTA